MAKVDEDGQLTVMGPGDGAIVVWFSSQIVLSRLTVPFANEIDEQVYQTAARRNLPISSAGGALATITMAGRLPPGCKTRC